MAEMEEEVLSSGISLELLKTSLSYTFPHSISPCLTFSVTQPYAKLPRYQFFDTIKENMSLFIMRINENAHAFKNASSNENRGLTVHCFHCQVKILFIYIYIYIHTNLHNKITDQHLTEFIQIFKMTILNTFE